MSENESKGLPELTALAGEAAIADAQATPTPTPEQAAAAPSVPQADRMAEAAMLLGILRPMLEMAVKYVKGAPENEWRVLQQPIADLLAYYDVDFAKWLSSPWAALAFAASPLVMRGVNNWQEENEKKQPKKVTAPGAPETPAPSAPVPGAPEPEFAPRG